MNTARHSVPPYETKNSNTTNTNNAQKIVVAITSAQDNSPPADPQQSWTAQDVFSTIESIVTANKALVNTKNSHGTTALMIAIHNYTFAIVEYLIAQLADINARDSGGQ